MKIHRTKKDKKRGPGGSELATKVDTYIYEHKKVN